MYKIRLPNFEGPFDLLLYFIKRDEINIYDIPIAKITEEFLSYIRILQFLDLELAGEFILMASTLIYIKTQMLLPRHDDEEANGEPEDPRTQLVQRLLEYRQVKEAAIELAEAGESQKYVYYRNLFEPDLSELPEGSEYKNATLFDLISAFKKALVRKDVKEITHFVTMFPITVEEQSKFILDSLVKKHRISFAELIYNQSRAYLVVTFLALLDLTKTKKIFFMQDELFEDIMIALNHELN